jgi:hypothetical protein
MCRKQRMKTLAEFLLLCLLLSSASVQAQGTQPHVPSSLVINYDAIIHEGLQKVKGDLQISHLSVNQLDALVKWYTLQPSVEFASSVGSSITVKFVDGRYIVIMDPEVHENSSKSYSGDEIVHQVYGSNDRGCKVVILNPAEYMYGHRQCQRIITILLRHDYSIEYLANQAVDLTFMESSLSADIVYMNTHAGYFDVDGDHVADAVVVATGELWTNETEQEYAFEYQHNLIVRGMVGDQSFIAFTPAFIKQYYTPKKFPDSLVFMATCYALYDSSMAQEFLDAGARVYIGWSQDTVFWTNSKASIQAFRLLSIGFSVQQVCWFIRSGGLYNWLFHSKLIFDGDGLYHLP